jgi:hypothetical protein
MVLVDKDDLIVCPISFVCFPMMKKKPFFLMAAP